MAVTGYAVMGDNAQSNILLNLDTSKAVIKVAIVMEVFNLLGTYIIGINPVFQLIEEKLGVENSKCVCVYVCVCVRVCVWASERGDIFVVLFCECVDLSR